MLNFNLLDILSKIQSKIGFNFLPEIIFDLVIIRIFEPASKLRSLELLDNFFGIRHNRKTYYKIAPQCIELKNRVEKQVLNFSENFYSFNYDILFYDVTTLYFETDKGYLICSFSKIRYRKDYCEIAMFAMTQTLMKIEAWRIPYDN